MSGLTSAQEGLRGQVPGDRRDVVGDQQEVHAALTGGGTLAAARRTGWCRSRAGEHEQIRDHHQSAADLCVMGL